MTRRIIAAVCMVLAVSCATGEPADAPDSTTSLATAPGDWQLDSSALVERAESLRDRSFDDPPAFVVERPDRTNSAQLSFSAATRRQADYLAEFLFGLDPSTPRRLLPHALTAERAAHYLPDRHVIQLDATSDISPDQMRRDALFALVVGLNHTHHNSLEFADSAPWDTTLGRVAAALGPAVLVATADLGADAGLTDPVSQITGYPELYDRIRKPEQTERSPPSSGAHEISSVSSLRRRLLSVLTRQGFALSAALFRSGGWSAAELPFSNPPTSTADVVRPDRWIAGAPTAEWSWPKPTGQVQSTGSVGPATTLVWLEQFIPAQYASTLFNGYESDRFRVITAPDHRRFEWVTMWNTPGSARQLAAAFDRILRRTLDDARRHAVLQGGLKVSVVIAEGERASATPDRMQDASTQPDVGIDSTSTRSQPDAGTDASSSAAPNRPIERLARHLLASNVRFIPRDGLPLEFVPTRRDAFHRQASSSSLDEMTWRDPATGVELDLSPVSNWQIRTSDSLPLRWLARSPHGATLQWSTTLQTPLDAAFGNNTYRNQLAERLAQAANIETSDVQFNPGDTTSRAGLTVIVQPDRSDAPTSVIWQYQCGDAVHSASLGIGQSSKPTRDEAAVHQLLDKVADDGQLRGCNRQTSNPASSEDEGSIDVKIHDN